MHDLLKRSMTIVIASSFSLVGGSSAMAFKSDLRKDVAGGGSPALTDDTLMCVSADHREWKLNRRRRSIG